MWRDSHKVLISSISIFSRYLAQPFGVNWAPLPYSEITGDIGHPGIDIAVPVGERVFASHSGHVIEVDNLDDRDGLGVVLLSNDSTYYTIYWHLSFNSVSVGDNVVAGQILGLSGGTGKSYGPHLHFGLYPCDIYTNVVNPKNGYGGAIDPLPYFYMPFLEFKYMDRKFVQDTYIFFFGRLPDQDELVFWEGKNYVDLFNAMLEGRADHFKKHILE